MYEIWYRSIFSSSRRLLFGCCSSAKRLCGTSDWDITPRTFRPRDRVQRAASQATHVVISRLLPSVANTPVFERGCAGRSSLTSSGTLRRCGIPSRSRPSSCLSSEGCMSIRDRQRALPVTLGSLNNNSPYTGPQQARGRAGRSYDSSSNCSGSKHRSGAEYGPVAIRLEKFSLRTQAHRSGAL
jgi:hypothetical protein